MSFGNDERYYEISGDTYPSVTTILSVIAKPALYSWYAKQGVSKVIPILDRFKELAPEAYQKVISELPKDFLKGGREILEEAANIGILAHSTIEKHLKGLPYDLTKIPKESKNAFDLFLKWQDVNKFKVLKTESVIYSKKYRFAGTMDCLVETERGIELWDWKTSKGIWKEMKAQCAAYKEACQEMTGENISWIRICRFGKTDVAFEVLDVPLREHESHFKAFLAALELYHWGKIR